jgi:hypothetical protein
MREGGRERERERERLQEMFCVCVCVCVRARARMRACVVFFGADYYNDGGVVEIWVQQKAPIHVCSQRSDWNALHGRIL